MNAKGVINSTLVWEDPDLLVRKLRWTREVNGKRYEGSKGKIIWKSPPEDWR